MVQEYSSCFVKIRTVNAVRKRFRLRTGTVTPPPTEYENLEHSRREWISIRPQVQRVRASLFVLLLSGAVVNGPGPV